MDQSLTKIRHARSQKDFPSLSLQDDEYIEFAFKRARICLFAIIGGTLFALIVILLCFLLTLLSESMIDDLGRHFVFIILGTLLAAAVLIAAVSVIVYHGNQLFITNKRVIQKVMTSPVSSSVNIIDLGSVEDVSFHKNGILQTLFGYGTLRLATVGDETSYTFKYSDIAQSDLDAVQKLIASAKKHPKPKAKDADAKDAAEEDTKEDTKAAKDSQDTKGSQDEAAPEAASAETSA